MLKGKMKLEITRGNIIIWAVMFLISIGLGLVGYGITTVMWWICIIGLNIVFTLGYVYWRMIIMK